MFYPLVRKGDFKRVFDQGLKFSSRHLVLYAMSNGLSFCRVGLSVSRRTGTAVVRNRIRRRLREIMRRLLSEHQPGYDLIIVARVAARDAVFADLSNSLGKAVSGLIHEKNTDRDNQNI